MILLHGDYQLKSRQQLNELVDQARQKDQEIVRLDGKKIDQTDLTEALRSQSFFGSDRLVVIENLFSRPQSQVKKSLIKIILRNPDQQVVFWESKKIDGRKLSSIKKFTDIKLFKTPAVIFKFLDNFQPNYNKQALDYLRQTLSDGAAELVLFLLARRVRNLIIAKTSSQDLQGAPWQKARLYKQAELFKEKKLVNIYQQILQIDRSIKTGQAILGLSDQLDLLVLDL